jgi:hypothetical protein
MPIEIAARTTMAIRIGIRGEEDESSDEEAGLTALEPVCEEPDWPWPALVEPLPWLPWSAPTSERVLGLPLFPEPPPDEFLDPEEPGFSELA